MMKKTMLTAKAGTAQSLIVLNSKCATGDKLALHTLIPTLSMQGFKGCAILDMKKPGSGRLRACLAHRGTNIRLWIQH